jgi:hypothetical protein
MIFRTNLSFDCRPLVCINMCGIVRMKHELSTKAFIVPIKLRIPAVHTNQCTAAHPFDVDDAKVVSGRIVGKISSRARDIPRQKALVVTINDLTFVADEIEAVMRLVRRRLTMGRSKNHPKL